MTFIYNIDQLVVDAEIIKASQFYDWHFYRVNGIYFIKIPALYSVIIFFMILFKLHHQRTFTISWNGKFIQYIIFFVEAP